MTINESERMDDYIEQLQQEQGAALTRETVLRDALQHLLSEVEYRYLGRDETSPHTDDAAKHAQAALATPSPAAEALLEVVEAAGTFEQADMSLGRSSSLESARRTEWKARADLIAAVQRWREVRR